MKLPFVSIVMGTYKRSAIIGRTLKSIVSQSFKDFEIVIVDDNHSSDQDEIEKTKRVIDEFNDSRIKYIKNDVNLGHPANFRKCFDQIQGKYFILFSDDDELLEGALETMVNYLEKNPIASLVHGYDTFHHPNGSGYKVSFSMNETKLVNARIYLESRLLNDGKYSWSQSAVMYRTEFMKYNNIPIVDNYMWDSIFHATYLLHSKEIGHINQHFCIRNEEEIKYTGRFSEAFLFHGFVEVDYMMLKFIKNNEAILISKNYKVNKFKKAIAWKLMKQFVHVTNFNHAIFCLHVALKELLSFYLTYMAWLPIKVISVIYGKLNGLKIKLGGKKGLVSKF